MNMNAYHDLATLCQIQRSFAIYLVQVGLQFKQCLFLIIINILIHIRRQPKHGIERTKGSCQVDLVIVMLFSSFCVYVCYVCDAL